MDRRYDIERFGLARETGSFRWAAREPAFTFLCHHRRRLQGKSGHLENCPEGFDPSGPYKVLDLEGSGFSTVARFSRGDSVTGRYSMPSEVRFEKQERLRASHESHS
jgi:hypothetical protein